MLVLSNLINYESRKKPKDYRTITGIMALKKGRESFWGQVLAEKGLGLSRKKYLPLIPSVLKQTGLCALSVKKTKITKEYLPSKSISLPT